MRYLSLATAFVLWLPQAAAIAQDFTGQRVTVIDWGAEFRVGRESKGGADLGRSYTVDRVEGDWLWIESHQAFLNKRHVFLYDDAIGHLTDVIAMDPTAKNYTRRATCWYGRGEFENCIADCTEALRINPDFATAYYWRGAARSDLGQFRRAIDDFDEISRLVPDWPGSFVGKSEAKLSLGDFEGALSDAQAAVERSKSSDSRYGGDLACRMIARQWLGMTNLAAADCDEVQKRDNLSDYARSMIAWFRATCPDERYRDADLALEYAIIGAESTTWKDHEVLDIVAAAYANAGDFEKAVEYQARAIEYAAEGRQAPYRERLELYRAGKPFRTPE